MSEEDKIEAAVVALEGDALLWFQWENSRKPIFHWGELKALLLRHFRPISSGSLHEQWLTHQQSGTVVEYRRRFVELLAPLGGISEEVAKGKFVSGLKGEIKVELRLHGPLTLDQCMDLAVKIEDKLSYGPGKLRQSNLLLNPPILNKPNITVTYKTPNTNTQTLPHTSITQNKPNTSSTFSNQFPKSQTSVGQSKVTTTVRRLSDKEMQEKREKGLCFRCDGKWTAGHRCLRRELSILCAEEDEEEAVELAEEEAVELAEEEPEEEEDDSPAISLNSVMGITSPKTMKMRGTISGQNVVVMIDPGATHNFISISVVEKLQIPITPLKSFGVSLGTGDAVQGEGECKQVVLEL